MSSQKMTTFSKPLQSAEDIVQSFNASHVICRCCDVWMYRLKGRGIIELNGSTHYNCTFMAASAMLYQGRLHCNTLYDRIYTIPQSALSQQQG
jgi:hypothetical protein